MQDMVFTLTPAKTSSRTLFQTPIFSDFISTEKIIYFGTLQQILITKDSIFYVPTTIPLSQQPQILTATEEYISPPLIKTSFKISPLILILITVSTFPAPTTTFFLLLHLFPMT